MKLSGKKIVLGVTGGIAAYKAVEIVSCLRKAGAEVHVIMTKEATEFVTSLTFREMSGQPVTVDMWDKVTHFNVEHIALAKLADIMLIAPATANIIAKIAVGIADDMLTTTLLATKAPIFIAPAMNTNMYDNPVTQRNIEDLKRRGFHIIEPVDGHLACGTVGKGRLPEPIDIVHAVSEAAVIIDDSLKLAAQLKGCKILVTAGGTIEPLDPVRYLGNRSTGRMGYAIAEEAARRGAEVVLVSGPTSLPEPPEGVQLIRVETACEMRDAVLAEYPSVQAVIKSAAVADYRPAEVAAQKIKKSDDNFILKLVRNPDILFELGQQKEHQVLVGFAAETCHVEEYARKKLVKKNLDFIVANDVSEADSGFGVDTNRIKLIDRNGKMTIYPLMSKRELAGIILEHVAEALHS